MFFVFGISQGKKMLDYAKTVICAQCGGYGRYQVFMTYSYFSLFFIPSAIDRPDSSEDDLLLFYNSTDQEYQESMKRIVGILEEDC